MSRDKQTEIMELARELCGEGEQHTDCFHCPTLRCCGVQKFARELYAKGYRKASEVAEEIFAEIEKEIELALDSNYKVKRDAEDMNYGLINYVEGKIHCLRGLLGFLDELKEKYTEEK